MLETRMERDQDFRIERKKIEAGYGMKEAHFHPYYELYYLYSGSCASFVNHTLYQVKAGDVILVNKMDIHRTAGYSGGTNERAVVNFTDRFLDVLRRECSPREVERILSVTHVSVQAGIRGAPADRAGLGGWEGG